MVSTPLDLPRSMRLDEKRALTSFKAGEFSPLAAFPLLREDQVRRGIVSVNTEMLETAELIMNPVNMRVSIFLVPWLAFPRFQGSMDVLNRSYMGQPPLTGEAVIPFFETEAMGAHGSKEVYKRMGIHAAAATQVNTMYGESYNLVWNYLAKNMSPNLTLRAMNDRTIADAFWINNQFKYIVPDFDQRVIDGEVPLSVNDARLPVSGIGFKTSSNETNVVSIKESDGSTVTYPSGWSVGQGAAPLAYFRELGGTGGTEFPDIFAELTDQGLSISLANIQLARKTQAFARLRERFAEHAGDDESGEWIIDLLMQAIHIPDQALKNPMLLRSETVQFGQQKRFASDSGALMESATNGGASVDLTFSVPRINTGGIVMAFVEVTPDQLFERQKDMFFHTDAVADLPNALRDFLDPEQVEVVTKDFVDVSHANPTETFGYAHTNHAWNRRFYNIGGKFFRPAIDESVDEERMRLWANEVANPTLGPDFYLASAVHQKVFLDTEADNFETVTMARLEIEGNTVFGNTVIEASDNYDEVLEEAPIDRIEKD